jgi:hypothetical protein
MILLCPVHDKAGTATLDEILGEKPISRDCLGAVEIVKAAATNVRTRKQFVDCNQHWPLSFHQDKRYYITKASDKYL